MDRKKAHRQESVRAPKVSPRRAAQKTAERAVKIKRRAREVGKAQRHLLERFPIEAAKFRNSGSRRSLPEIEAIGGKLPAPLLRWIEDDLTFAATALEELGLRLDRYRCVLLKEASFDENDAPLDREAQLIGILGSAVDLIDDAYGIIQFERPETQFGGNSATRSTMNRWTG